MPARHHCSCPQPLSQTALSDWRSPAPAGGRPYVRSPLAARSVCKIEFTTVHLQQAELSCADTIRAPATCPLSTTSRHHMLCSVLVPLGDIVIIGALYQAN